MENSNRIDKERKISSLENLTDEQLVELKKQAIETEDYDKAKEIKQEQERRKWLELQEQKVSFLNEKSKRIDELQKQLLDENKYEYKKPLNEYYMDIWRSFSRYSSKIRTRAMKDLEGKIGREKDECYYNWWQELFVYLKNFCSWYSYNVYENPELNNHKLILMLWLKEEFNNIYRRCLMLSDQYYDKIINWEEYFNEMNRMFSFMDSTIEKSMESWFYPKNENRNMPML